MYGCGAGKLAFLGELNVFVRTASKYDDCRVLRVPALRLSVKLGWQCVGDPRDHHAVAPCAPTRLPEYSSNQVLTYCVYITDPIFLFHM